MARGSERVLNLNVYDFDKTIYSGDSTLDFTRFCYRRHPLLLRFLPGQVLAFVPYALGLIGKTAFKQRFYRYFRGLKDIDAEVRLFWETHRQKIKPWYLEQKSESDGIVSASPEFLFRPICAELGIVNLIASRVDPKTGVYTGENCYGEEKVVRFRETFGDAPIERFYSDSLSDSPLAALATESFLVSGGKTVPWAEYKPSKIQKAKRFFFSKEFARFLLIGGINTFNGVLFAYLFSLILQPNLAFAAGYLLSLAISYLLNSFFTFHESLRFSKYIKFCVSYIPNFLIQNAFVLVFMNWLGFGKLITYILAAVVGIPVTFAMLKLFAFRKRKKENKAPSA